MHLGPLNLKARWSGLAALAALAVSAAAQQTIQFTKPVDQDPAGKANASLPPTSRRNSADAFNAPSSLFGERTPEVNFDVLPGSQVPNAAAAANAAQWQKILEDRKNWTLMTQEEIMGVLTPEKILGITDPDDDPKISQVERFLKRRQRLDEAGATNLLHHPDASHWRADAADADPRHPSDASSRFAQTLGGSVPELTKNPGVFFDNANPNLPADVNRKTGSIWSSPFGLPEPLPKPTPEQLAGMDRFRALMEPDVAEKAPDASRYSSPAASAPNPILQTLPGYNPVGRSFSTLESDIAKPTGLAPLPGAKGPHPVPAKTAPLVQPPPWISDSPQPATPPQRQF